MTAAIDLCNIVHRYGPRIALNDVSFRLDEGEFLALLGPNGAGKTTIFSLLTRLLRLDQGEITIFGANLRREPGRALAKMGVVFQQPTLDLDLTISQNLAYHGAIQGLHPKTVAGHAERELTRFGLWERRNERVRALNGGHRRRVEIARALLHEPSLLLLDEASAGLDLESRTALYQHVRSLCDERGLAVLWTTHLVEELSTSDRAVLLQQGAIKDQGVLAELVAQHDVHDTNALVLGLLGGQA